MRHLIAIATLIASGCQTPAILLPAATPAERTAEPEAGAPGEWHYAPARPTHKSPAIHTLGWDTRPREEQELLANPEPRCSVVITEGSDAGPRTWVSTCTGEP